VVVTHSPKTREDACEGVVKLREADRRNISTHSWQWAESFFRAQILADEEALEGCPQVSKWAFSSKPSERQYEGGVTE
jgi:hypothetical protein